MSEQTMNKITPFLWFNDNAEAAADYYLSIFPDGRKLNELRCTEAGPLPVGALLAIDIEIAGQQVTFLNGGPAQKLSDAFSFVIRCESQQEIDDYWANRDFSQGIDLVSVSSARHVGRVINRLEIGLSTGTARARRDLSQIDVGFEA